MSSYNRDATGADIVALFPEKITGKTFVITGPTKGGLGAQTAINLAQGKPDKILLLGRNESKVTPVIEEIRSISPSTEVHFVPLDLASFKSIRNAATIINNSVLKIDVLINNAGVMAVKDYTLTEEGLEYQFGANHIGHFLLKSLLVPKIEAAGKGARVVNLTSMGHQMLEIRFDDINFNNGKAYNKWFAYGQSKTANILFTVALAKKLAFKGVLAFAVHPGGITETNLANHVEKEEWEPVWQIFVIRGFHVDGVYKNLKTGTAGTLYAALDPSLESHSGVYIDDTVKIGDTPDYAHNPEIAEKLWGLSEKIVGEKFQL